MQKINLNGKEALVIDVEMDAKDFMIERNGLYWKSSVWGLPEIGHLKKLPSGKYSILGTITNGVPDFDVDEYIESFNDEQYNIIRYRDFGMAGLYYTIDNKIVSFNSLLHSQGVITKRKQILLIQDFN